MAPPSDALLPSNVTLSSSNLPILNDTAPLSAPLFNAVFPVKVESFIDEVNIPMDIFFIFDYGYRQLRKKYSSDFEKLQKLEQEIGSVENNLSEMCVERDKLKRRIARDERRNKLILDENTLNSFEELKKDFEKWKMEEIS